MPEASGQTDSDKGGETTMYWHDGWAWFWMVPMMFLWVVVLGAVVYAAVRLASHDSRQH